MELFNFDSEKLLGDLLKLLVAFLLPLFTAWDRENAANSAGLRTFPLVAMASCSFTILAMSGFGDENAQSKVIAGIVTGIGFIGGGAILKYKSDVSGLSTAAALWTTGAVGIAVGFGRIEIALPLSVMTFITFKLFGEVKKQVKDEEQVKDEQTGEE